MKEEEIDLSKVIRDQRGWIGIDLDGTLAFLSPKKFPEIGAPIKAMVEKINNLILDGEYDIKIFTARACDPQEVERIKKWLKEWRLPNFEITNVKDYDCVQIWDDRARQVIFNTGLFLDGGTVL